ncbi:MAG: hypothetical protein MJ246_05735 [Clostridia bacterium]|nr:hypothetical protein [Clostridia bacterium]
MRKFLLGLFAIALSVSLVACGNNEEVSENEENEEVSEETSDEEALYFEDGKVTLEDGTEVTLGTKEVDGNIVINETAELPNGEKVLSEITYIYNGEDLQDITVVMTARTKAYAEEIANNQEILGGGIDTASIEVKGNKVYAKMDETTIAEMKAVPKSMMAQLFTK